MRQATLKNPIPSYSHLHNHHVDCADMKIGRFGAIPKYKFLAM